LPYIPSAAKLTNGFYGIIYKAMVFVHLDIGPIAFVCIVLAFFLPMFIFCIYRIILNVMYQRWKKTLRAKRKYYLWEIKRYYWGFLPSDEDFKFDTDIVGLYIKIE
jgi:hypothetical protein